MKIGIFGGTFNPIHYGHLRAAEEVREAFAFDKLLIIPSGKPPFKKPWFANAQHRYEMAKAAIKGNPFLEISDIEIKTKETSYSVKTISKLTDKYKNAEFFFIIGIDAFLDLPQWKEPSKLIELTNLVIITRPGFYFTDLSSSPYFANVSKKTLKEFGKEAKKRLSLKLKTGMKAFLFKVTKYDISASRIRSLLKKGGGIKYLLPDSVESYIISHKLYQK